MCRGNVAASSVYGKGQIERAKVTGKSGDEGIDGVIPQDRLGLDMVYVQAKRHENAVGPRDIDKFVGSLMRKKATKGVFITSGTFAARVAPRPTWCATYISASLNAYSASSR